MEEGNYCLAPKQLRIAEWWKQRCPWYTIIRGNWAVCHPIGLIQPKMSSKMSPYNPLLLARNPFPKQTSFLSWGEMLSIWLLNAEKTGVSSRYLLHFEGTVSGNGSWMKTDLPPTPTTLLLTPIYKLLLPFPEQHCASRWKISSGSSKTQSGQDGRGEKKGDLESQVFITAPPSSTSEEFRADKSKGHPTGKHEFASFIATFASKCEVQYSSQGLLLDIVRKSQPNLLLLTQMPESDTHL